jgi:hypothetical protein
MTGWYHRFMPNYAHLACPLTNMLKDTEKVLWTDEANEAFIKIKSCLVSAPVLAAPSFDEPFTMRYDSTRMRVDSTRMRVDSTRIRVD